MTLFRFENSDTGSAKENRLLYKQYKNPTLKRAKETKETTKETGELIQEIVDNNPNKPEYKIFEGKSADFRTLVEYIRLQKLKNPTSPTGIDKNHPNLKKLAKQYAGTGEKKEALESLNRRLESMRKTVASLKEKKNIKGENFQFTGMDRGQINNAKTEINKVLKYQDKDKLKDVPLIDTTASGRESLGSTKYREFINIVPTGKFENKSQLSGYLSDANDYQQQLIQALVVAKENAKKMNEGVLAAISSEAPEGTQANAERYAELVQKDQIDYIKRHLEFVTKSYFYLKAVEATPQMKALDDMGIRREQESNRAAIEAKKAAINGATSMNNTEAKKTAEAELDMLENYSKILKNRLKMSDEGKLAEYESYISAGQAQPVENMEMAMDMYLMVMDEIKKKYGKQLPRDPRTRAYLLTTAMLKGVDTIDRFAALEGIKIGPNYKIQETKKGYKYDKLFQSKEFTLKSENEAFLDANGLPDKDVMKNFELASYEEQIRHLHAELEVDLIVLRVVYGQALDEDYTPDEKYYQEYKERLNGMHGKATLLDKTLEEYTSLDGAVLVETDIATAKKIPERIKAIKMIPEVNFYYNNEEKGEIRKELEKINKLYMDIEDTKVSKGLMETFKKELNNKIAVSKDEDERKMLSDRMERIKAMEQYGKGLGGKKVTYMSKIDEITRKRPLKETVLYKMLSGHDIATMSPENKKKWREIMEKMTTTYEDAKGNKTRIVTGNGLLATEIIGDIQNNFVHRRNEVRMKELADILEIPEDKVKDYFKNVEAQALEGMSEFQRVMKVNKIEWRGAWYRYFKGNYWSKPETQVGVWEKDLDEKLANKKGGESAPVKVLTRILADTEGNKAFLEALKDLEHPEHENAREALRELIREFQRRTTQAQKDLKNKIDYEEGMYDEGNTLKERVHKIGSHVFENIFGSGVRPEVRLVYGFLAYVVISKGISGKGPLGKIIRTVGIGAGLGMIYENATGKPALGFLGIDSPAESARGSWLHKEAKNSGIDYNDKAGYRALDTLKDKKVEDIIKWYDGRGKYGWNDQDKAKNRGYSHYSSLIRSGLLKPRELDEIMPDETNKEEIGAKFVEVIEKELLKTGKRATHGTITDREQLLKAGRDDLYYHFTSKGFKEAIDKGMVSYMAPDEAKDLESGGYKWNYKEATEVISTAAEWEEANREHEGLLGVPSWLYNEMVEYKNKALPGWLRLKGHAKYVTDEFIRKFSEDYGPEAWRTMKEWGEKGWEFTLETGREISVWWKKSETALKIKRTANNMWEVVTTGVKLPFVVTLELGDRAADTMASAMGKLETNYRRWSDNEHPIKYDMFPDETGPFNTDAATRKANLAKKLENLELNAIANGYDVFGKFEKDWYDMKTKTGLLARPGLLKNPMHRFDFHIGEGYINFMGIEKNIEEPIDKTRTNAFRNAVDNLVEFLNKPENIAQLNPNDEFTQAIKSRNAEKIRASVEPFIQKFGAFHNDKNGYMLFLRVPVPLHEKYRHIKTYEHIDAVTGYKSKKPVRYNAEYYQRKNGNWRRKGYGDLDKFKHSIIFTIDDEELNKFMTELQKDKRWGNEFAKSFYLWETIRPRGTRSLDVNDVLTYAQGAAEGEVLTEYGEYDNMKAKFFMALKDNYLERFLAEQHWSRNHLEMHNELQSRLGKQVADQFDKYHKVIAAAAAKVSKIEGIKQHFSADATELAYRQYLAKHLTAFYRNENVPKNQKGKTLKKNKWIPYLSEKFIKEDVANLPESVIMSILGGAKKALNLVFTKLNMALNNELEEMVKSQGKKKTP